MTGTRTRTSAAAVKPRRQGANAAVSAFEVEVRSVRRLSANFQRITFGGECLRSFGVQGSTDDLRIKVVIPPVAEDGTRQQLPELNCDDTGWYQNWLAMDAQQRGSMRTYTVRASRCAAPAPEIDVDFVLHFDADGVGGPASAWAAQAQPGDRVTVIGPNAVHCVTAESYGGIEWRPGLARHVLLAGDETAVPAVASILENLPEGVTGHALLEIPDETDAQPISTRSGVVITWLPRGGRPHGELLERAVREAVAVPGYASLGTADGAPPATVAPGRGQEPEEVDIDSAILWETPARLTPEIVESSPSPNTPAGALPFYAWIAGEAAVVRGLRRYLVRDAGIDRKQVAFMGYWRHGRAELS
ncbi:siderophore-interacting protein [Arthrobacter sp. Sa2CUA1]|uniref:Siderophore-interacting protein n=1 Tax=Arthrobacter gallicola TaxID=2762225 RepID=A0ABR8UTE1_9MICC|nr:siderophore-interacting protein [Arthrobacter gallicola]MBD7995810.1 siderophore-interacting protein [Arthrobacter gallicola]